MVEAIEKGFPQREIQNAAYAHQIAVERKEQIIVGVNDFRVEDEAPIDILKIDESVAREQIAGLKRLRAERDQSKVEETLAALKTAAGTDENMMEPVLTCVRAYATLGEICDTLRSVYGTYAEPEV